MASVIIPVTSCYGCPFSLWQAGRFSGWMCNALGAPPDSRLTVWPAVPSWCPLRAGAHAVTLTLNEDKEGT